MANGETKLCKHCQTEIPKKAKVCPNCRRKQGLGCLPIGLIVIGVIILLGIIFGSGGDKKAEEDQTSADKAQATSEAQATKEAANKTEDIKKKEEKKDKKKKAADKKIEYKSYDCTELFDDLNANALKAEKSHQDEYVKVTGYLGTIDSDGGYIGLSAGEDNYDYMLQEIHCSIKSDDQLNKIMDMEKGDEITVKGKITSIGELLGYNLDIIEIK